MQKLEQLWKLPFCKAIQHAVVIDKFFEDCKTNELAALIDSSLYETNKYVKVPYNVKLWRGKTLANPEQFAKVLPAQIYI